MKQEKEKKRKQEAHLLEEKMEEEFSNLEELQTKLDVSRLPAGVLLSPAEKSQILYAVNIKTSLIYELTTMGRASKYSVIKN